MDADPEPDGAEDMETRRRLMTTAPVERLVARLALPTMAIMTVSALYNAADAYFVGYLGTSAIAAVGIAFPLMAAIQAIGFFFGHGAGNHMSRRLGARDFSGAGAMASAGFFSSLFLGGALGLVGILRLVPLAALLGATPTIIPHAIDYLFYILLGAPLICASFTLNNLLRFQGSALHGMFGMLTGAVLNIGLDPLFIFGLGLGVSGASLATLVSQAAGFFLLLAASGRRGNISPEFRLFSPSPAAYREMARGGFPSLCRQGLASAASLCLNHAAGAFGDPVIAAMAVVQRISMFANSLLIGFGQGFQPVCGFNYGAGRPDRVGRAFWFCAKASGLGLAVLAAAGYAYAPELISLFREDDAAVAAVGAPALRFRCLTMILVGWIILNNMLLQTIGSAGRAAFLALAWQGLFLIPLLFALPPWLGTLGIQLSQPLADLATFLCSLPLGAGVLKKMRREREASPSVNAK